MLNSDELRNESSDKQGVEDFKKSIRDLQLNEKTTRLGAYRDIVKTYKEVMI